MDRRERAKTVVHEVHITCKRNYDVFSHRGATRSRLWPLSSLLSLLRYCKSKPSPVVAADRPEPPVQSLSSDIPSRRWQESKSWKIFPLLESARDRCRLFPMAVARARNILFQVVRSLLASSNTLAIEIKPSMNL